MNDHFESQETGNEDCNKKESENTIDDTVKALATPHRVQPQTNMDFWVNHPKPKEKRKTYPQPWHEYNLAETSEKLMFMDILTELLVYVKTKKKTGRGRPKLNVQEMLFCMNMLVYSGKSSRRIISELHLAKDRNYLTRVPHFNSILNYFENEELKDILKYLISISSMPLKSVEKDFAADASGFTTSVFGRWFDHKWGKEEKKRVWRKAHVMSGVYTNVITSVEVTPSNVADTTAFPDLLKKTTDNFQAREISADMAYLSRKNLELVSESGAIPFIPFKSNISGKSKGCMIWKRMYQYFQWNYDEYLTHYHKRSNAETVFSMIKRKFGGNLRTKTETSQDNEILCKCLCHNIAVLIHAVFELNLNIEFEESLKGTNFYANDNSAQIFHA